MLLQILVSIRLAIANRVPDRVALAVKCGPAIVPAADEETTTKDLLVYAAEHFLGITRQRLGENVQKMCIDGNRLPGKAWFTEANAKELPHL